MKINRITLTGADDKTDINDLVNLSKEFTFVEWGILYARDPGRGRYPSYSWIAELQAAHLPKLSAHLCGEFSRDIFQRADDQFFNNLVYCGKMYKRSQLNYNFSNTPFKIENLESVVEKHPEVEFIIQNNKSNRTTVEEILSTMVFENIVVLHDASGGRGREIKDMPAPFDVYTGYSGGLNPENIEENLKKIVAIKAPVINLPLVKYEVMAWADMESGVRTDDVFDIEKVKRVLSIASKYISYE